MFLIDCAAQAIGNKELQVILKIAMQTRYVQSNMLKLLGSF